jgi:hypothetical protein
VPHALAVWEGVQKRLLMVALKASHPACGADAARPVPHHLRVPEALHAHGVEVDAVKVEQALDHGQRAAHAFLTCRRVCGAQQKSVVGRRAGHQPLQPAAGGQQGPAGLACQVHDVQQHPGFHDLAA